MKYIASVIFEGKIKIIEEEYSTKKAFAEDLRSNGYRVRFISTEEKFNDDCTKYNEKCERNKYIKNTIYASHKESAKRMNMTVKEYRAWLKAE